MAKRYGTVLVFRAGLDPDVIVEKLGALCAELVEERDEPFMLSEFDDEDGYPVWYLP